jgi:OOP family OmpA-OmpF porin
MSQLRLALLAVIVMACSSGGGSETTAPPNNTPPNNTPPNNTPPTTGSTNTINAKMTGDYYGEAVFTWEPSSMTVAVGTTVSWSNSTGTAHNVTFDQAPGAPSNIGAFTGQNTRTFNSPGSFSYQCTLHAGMSGRVVVQ